MPTRHPRIGPISDKALKLLTICRGTGSSNPSPSSGESSELGVALTRVATSKDAAFTASPRGGGLETVGKHCAVRSAVTGACPKTPRRGYYVPAEAVSSAVDYARASRRRGGHS